MVAAKATKQGQGGCQLWIRDTLGIKPTDLAVVRAEPRVLAVGLILAQRQILIVVAHAPHSQADPEARTARWESLERLLTSCQQQTPLLLIDANTTVGHAASDAFGPLDPDPPNANTADFTQLL